MKKVLNAVYTRPRPPYTPAWYIFYNNHYTKHVDPVDVWLLDLYNKACRQGQTYECDARVRYINVRPIRAQSWPQGPRKCTVRSCPILCLQSRALTNATP